MTSRLTGVSTDVYFKNSLSRRVSRNLTSKIIRASKTVFFVSVQFNRLDQRFQSHAVPVLILSLQRVSLSVLGSGRKKGDFTDR